MPIIQQVSLFQFNSTIFSRINQNAGFLTETLSGEKTGYTPQAGQCLVSFVGYHDKEYLIVSGAASGDNFSGPFHIQAIFIYTKQ